MSKYKFLIISPSWVGDMIMAQSLFKNLKEQYPNCIIHVLAPKSSLALTTFMPEVSKAILGDFKHNKFNFFKRIKLGKCLRKNNYTHAIVLPNSWKSSIVPFAAGISIRRGWLGEQRYLLLNQYKKLNKNLFPLMIDRFNALTTSKFNASIDPRNLYPEFIIPNDVTTNIIKKFNINNLQEKIITICPGAEFGPAKKWPSQYFAQFTNFYIKQGFRVWILGGPNDIETSKEILKEVNNLNQIEDYTGKTTLIEAIALLNLSKAILSNDSGLMHAASALKKKVLVIYGSTSNKFTPPLSQSAEIIYNEDINCRPCFKRVCPLEHTNCLRDLNPSLVIKKFNELLNN